MQGVFLLKISLGVPLFSLVQRSSSQRAINYYLYSIHHAFTSFVWQTNSLQGVRTVECNIMPRAVCQGFIVPLSLVLYLITIPITQHPLQ